MASTTGIPNDPIPASAAEEDEGRRAEQGEYEPLLGRPGDVSQTDEAPILKNLILGTGVIAEIAALLLVASVWASVFLAGPLILFSVHPLAQSLGLLILVQSILVLQPTHTAAQKQVGQKIHAGLNLLAFITFAVGVVSIEVNKFRSNGAHFKSLHGTLGIAAGAWFLGQYIVGFTMFALPQLYGGEAKAKAVWKYHRASGYVLLLLLSATVISAADTDYNKNVLGLPLWAMVLIMGGVLVGTYPRIKKQKLGL